MEKIKNAIGGVVGGFICIIIGIVLLWWNEGNDVKNIKTIEEARGSLVNVSSESVDSSNEGKLVSTNGKIKVIDESLKDDYFNIIVPNTGKLVRVVEMYQWVEECETEDDRTVCEYDKEWLTTLESSSSFEESGHDNPSTMPFEEAAYYANEVELGAFKLSSTQIQMLSTGATVTPDQNAFLPNGYKVLDKYITSADSMSNPNIGDVRVSFKYNTDTTITVLAMQKGNSFADFKSKQGKVLNELRSGALTGEEMIDVVETQNNILKWVLRLVGVLLVTGGFAGLLTPILMVLSIIPLVGDGIAGVLRFIASLVGFAVSMLVIAIAWIAFRPLIGICLLAVVVGIVALIVVLIKKNKAKVNGQQPMMQQSMANQGMVQQPQMMGQQPMMQPQPQMMGQQPMMQPQSQMMGQQPVMQPQPQMMPQQPMMQPQPQITPQQQVVPQQPVNPLEQQQMQAQQMAAQQQVQAQQAQQDPMSIFGQNNNQQ